MLHTEDTPAQTALTGFQIGGTDAFKPTWYWSSSQRSANFAFSVGFDGGTQYSFGKHYELRVRPVRSQLID
ncbi:hypothetical protein D3C71_2052310 [compost metagenome]